MSRITTFSTPGEYGLDSVVPRPDDSRQVICHYADNPKNKLDRLLTQHPDVPHVHCWRSGADVSFEHGVVERWTKLVQQGRVVFELVVRPSLVVLSPPVWLGPHDAQNKWRRPVWNAYGIEVTSGRVAEGIYFHP